MRPSRSPDPKRCSPCRRLLGANAPFQGRPAWRDWHDSERVQSFRDTALDDAFFFLKWLTLACVIEAMMLRHVPANLIAQVLGGEGLMPILPGAIVGAPAHLDGYTAVPLVDALLNQRMSQGAPMSFVIAGGVSCIPAAIAVRALVRSRVFAAYLGFAVTGAVLSGLAWQMLV